MKKVPFMLLTFAMAIIMSNNIYAGEWKNDANGWWYQNDDGSYSVNAWKEINDHWYYFDESGYMLTDTTTPDGYKLNKSGEWDGNPIKEPGVMPMNKGYVFKESGKWVSKGKIPAGDYIYYPTEGLNRTPIVRGSSCTLAESNYIRIYDEDVLEPGNYVPIHEAGELDITKEGTFLVGKDIKEGTYNLTKAKKDDGKTVNIALCTVFNTIPSSKDEYAPQKNIATEFYVSEKRNNTVTVKNGQYVQLIECNADFERP